MKENNNCNDANTPANKNTKIISLIVAVAVTITLGIGDIFDTNYNEWSSDGRWE